MSIERPTAPAMPWAAEFVHQAHSATTQRGRLRGAMGVAVVGLTLTWAAGYGLMKLSGRSLGEPWILRSMAASGLALVGAALSAIRPPSSPFGATVAVAGLAAARRGR